MSPPLSGPGLEELLCIVKVKLVPGDNKDGMLADYMPDVVRIHTGKNPSRKELERSVIHEFLHAWYYSIKEDIALYANELHVVAMTDRLMGQNPHLARLIISFYPQLEKFYRKLVE